jgi:hypothetical protein
MANVDDLGEVITHRQRTSAVRFDFGGDALGAWRGRSRTTFPET